MSTAEIRHFHLFAGLGGGARGFNRTSYKAHARAVLLIPLSEEQP